jgi:phosphatidylglycerol---prolipoprotein diacylglyceryl transferase
VKNGESQVLPFREDFHDWGFGLSHEFVNYSCVPLEGNLFFDHKVTMQQVLFTLPIKTSWFPDGIPIHGFGMMLFFCFVICTWFAARKAKKIGFPPERMQDLAIVLFITGIIGARITFMIQYGVPWSKFFNIWEGGIVFYGSAIGGFVGYWIFYYLVLRRLRISTWQLADAIAPAIALGLVIGRLGCFMNGCCYGHVACEECPKIAFPLLTAPVREVVVDKQGYQTTVGFTVKSTSSEDVRSVVEKIEKGSAAERAGLKEGDKILQVNGEPNGQVLGVRVDADKVDTVIEWFRNKGAVVTPVEVDRPTERGLKIIIPEVAKLNEITKQAQKELQLLLNTSRIDSFRDMLLKWKNNRHDLELVVERDGQQVSLPSFTPRSLGLHPTQLYESVSMGLLMLFLISYYPFRRHDGQVFVLLIVGYAIHRFLNEIIRNDTPVEGFQMTLSQNLSVLMLVSAIALELWLRYTQENRWKSGIREEVRSQKSEVS